MRPGFGLRELIQLAWGGALLYAILATLTSPLDLLSGILVVFIWLATLVVLPLGLYFREWLVGGAPGYLRRANTALLIGTVLLLLGYIPVGRFMHDRALAAITERGRPVIEAIRAHESEHGRPPEHLADLVPTYLEALPESGVWPHTGYLYAVDEDGWTLTVEIEFFSTLTFASGARALEGRKVNGWAYNDD